MEIGRKTQKQVAGKYTGNLSYFKRPGLLRKMRFWLGFFSILIGGTAIFLYVTSGEKTLYNTGPISAGHAALASDCQSCHGASNGELIQDKLIPLLTTWKNRALLGENPFQEKPADFFARLEVDSSCVRCHQAQAQHAPDWFSLATMDQSPEIVSAESGACSSCHKEHVGSGPMKMPDSTSCMACHNDPHRLAESARRIPLATKSLPVASHRRLADGSIHFIPPVKPGHLAPTFVSFADGHPDFAYQAPDVKDPNILRFNHVRHAQADIPSLNGKRLDCIDCHKPAEGGQFYAPVTYKNNCASCHTLQFDPDNIELTLPHGDPETVRTYLRNLPYQYAELAKRKGFDSADVARKFTFQALTKLKARVLNGENFENQIFFTSNPYRSQNPTGERAYFTGCMYCHEVKRTPNNSRATIQITHPETTDRWLAHGRFNHATHTHASCIDCHAANKSTATSDIILPTKASCVECHRPLDAAKTTSTTPAEGLSASVQRAHGGVRSDCATCHSYHPDGQTFGLLKQHPDLFPNIPAASHPATQKK